MENLDVSSGIEETRKPRMHWALRCGLYLLAFFLVAGFGEIFIPRLMEGILPGWSESMLDPVIDFLINIIAAAILIGLFCWWTSTGLAGLGLEPSGRNYKDLLFGLAIGAGLIALIVGILYLKGDIRFEPGAFTTMTLLQLLMFISVGVIEEVLTRGVLQHTMVRAGKPVLAIVLPSVFFGLMHLLNPLINVLAVVNTILVGLILALVTYYRKNLYWAIGFHITWNFFLSVVFGLTVSGINLEEGRILESVLLKPDIWNGGDYGIEAGLIVSLLFCLIAVWLIIAHRAKRFGEAYIVTT